MKTWITIDGDEIPLKKLKRNHLLNIIKFIEKRANEGMTLRQGGDSWDIDSFWYEEWDIKGEEVLKHFDYKSIIKEAKRRKLKLP